MTNAFVDAQVPGWLAARRYGAPAAMITAAMHRREAGDWRGACAAARVDIHIDLGRIRDAHGTEVAARLEDDLLHFVPDLARWHAPRHPGSPLGLLVPGWSVTLADYDGLRLSMRMPAHAERPQRIALHCVPRGHDGGMAGVEDWTGLRDLWDARATAGLLGRLGGGDRAPFFHRDGTPLSRMELAAQDESDPVALMERVIALQDGGEVETAWQTAGFRADFSRPERYRYLQRTPPGAAATVPAFSAQVRAALTRPGASVLVLRTPGLYDCVVLSMVDGQLHAGLATPWEVRDEPVLPRPVWQRLPDLELLRTGHIGADEVHPLVRAAMFPDQSDPGYRPREAVSIVDDIAVRCRRQWHRLSWRDGRLATADHTPDEVDRERVMRSLGGEVPACVDVADAWAGLTQRRLPRPLRELRARAMPAVLHGRDDLLLRLVNAGVDLSGLTDRWRRGPLHHLAKVDAEEALLPLLLASGADINARDGKGRTPLGCVLFDGGSADLVRAMLNAGADPLVLDETGENALHLLRCVDADTIVPWLVAAGVALDGVDEYGRTPLFAQVLTSAPVEALRATLAAGADPTFTDTYSDQSLADFIEQSGRDDLDFLVAAVGRPASQGGDRLGDAVGS
jgi:hypothetical protein